MQVWGWPGGRIHCVVLVFELPLSVGASQYGQSLQFEAIEAL